MMNYKHRLKLSALYISFIYCTFLGYITNAWAQDQLLGVYGSLDYGYRNLSAKDATSTLFKQERDFFEYPGIGYTIGANYNYRKNKNTLMVTTQYTVRGYDENNTGQPQNSTFIPLQYQAFYYFQFIDLGVAINHYLSEQKLSLFLHGGLSGSYFISAVKRRVDYFEDGTMQDISTDLNMDQFNRFTAQLLGGIGLEYKQTENLLFRFTPVFTYGLSSILPNSLKENLFSGSIRLTALYQLRSK